MLASFHVGAFLRLHYFLLVYFQFLTFCTVRALATQLLPGRRIMPFLLAAAVVGGFWGQYILDIDAWSQSSCMPLIALSLLLFIKLAQAAGSIERSPETLKLLILYALAWVGMFYLYPEAAGFVLPAHALCWIIGICLLRIRISWQSIGLTAIAAAGLLLPVTYSNLMFLVFQAKGTALAGVTWWTYFQAFLVGQGGPNGDLFSKGVASPFRMTASARSLLNRTAISAAIVFLFLQLAFFCYRPVASPSASGIHYSTPYPANPANLKKTINFADWSFLRHVKTRGFSASPACSCMHIASDSVWKRLRLIARGIPEMSYQRRPVQKQLFV
jgi:hypothetical protein